MSEMIRKTRRMV